MTKELDHLVMLATRDPWMTDHAHDEWKLFAWRKANALERESPASYAGLAAALTERIKTSSKAGT